MVLHLKWIGEVQVTSQLCGGERLEFLSKYTVTSEISQFIPLFQICPHFHRI